MLRLEKKYPTSELTLRHRWMQLHTLRDGLTTLVGSAQRTSIDNKNYAYSFFDKASKSRILLTKTIDFFQSFVKQWQQTEAEDTNLDNEDIQSVLQKEYSRAVHTLLTEEILLSLWRNEPIQSLLQQKITTTLTSIWQTAELTIDAYPCLESAWNARSNSPVQFGCLLGASEYFHLADKKCDPQFLEFFQRDEATTEEQQSFEEFLFDLTLEEIQIVRSEMKSAGMDAINASVCEELLGRPVTTPLTTTEAIVRYQSHARRQQAATRRYDNQLPGPTKTAEAYITAALLT